MPSSVGTPSAAVKFPSDPPPVAASSSSKPSSEASLRACLNSAIVPAFRSIGGRLMPPVTVSLQCGSDLKSVEQLLDVGCIAGLRYSHIHLSMRLRSDDI